MRSMRPAWCSGLCLLAMALPGLSARDEVDPGFVRFRGEPIRHAASGLSVEPIEGSNEIRVRNDEAGVVLTLPWSDWMFRTDRLPIEASDTELWVTVRAVRSLRTPQKHMERLLEELLRQPGLAVGHESLSERNGLWTLAYHSAEAARLPEQPNPRGEWNFRTCVETKAGMYELHLVHRDDKGRSGKIDRILTSFTSSP